MKKRILTIALSLIFICLGVFTFSACEAKNTGKLNVTKYINSCGVWDGEQEYTDASGDKISSLAEYKEHVFAGLEVEYTPRGSSTALTSKGLEELRNNGGTLTGWTGGHVGKCTVTISFGRDAVSYTFEVKSAGTSVAEPSTTATGVKNNTTTVTESTKLTATNTTVALTKADNNNGANAALFTAAVVQYNGTTISATTSGVTVTGLDITTVTTESKTATVKYQGETITITYTVKAA